MSTQSVIVTDAAAIKVWSLMQEEENLDLCLRAYISGGGCSGFQYNFTFEENPQEDDQTFKKAVDSDEEGEGAVTLLIDPMSYPYLKGATIDYADDINGERFVINNPNAKTTCGCGSSFSG